MGQAFQQHLIEWTDEKVSRFWDYCVATKARANQSFSKLNGKELVKLARPYLTRKGRHLDYGCGGGYLMECLLKQGFPCEGADLSTNSIRTAAERLSRYAAFGGTLPLNGLPNQHIGDNTYDFVFFIEVIEHLLPQERAATLRELYRIVKDGGYLMVSTPNNEDLSRQTVLCPECGAIFHDTQHVFRYTEQGLEDLMREIGFSKVLSLQTFLPKYRNLYRRIRFILSSLNGRLQNRPFVPPHLIFIGRKRSGAN
ncbi:MAG: class I SAM-dependent methyltransferase [Terracidiphilus sp.]